MSRNRKHPSSRKRNRLPVVLMLIFELVIVLSAFVIIRGKFFSRKSEIKTEKVLETAAAGDRMQTVGDSAAAEISPDSGTNPSPAETVKETGFTSTDADLAGTETGKDIDLTGTETGEDADLVSAETEQTSAPEAEAGASTEEQEISFHPACTADTRPSNLLASTEIEVDGEYLSDTDSYTPASRIEFENGSKYTNAKGIITFRGNNFRNSPSYGFAEMTDFNMTQIWSQGTGSLTYGDASWSGSGWTGQPLIVKWDAKTKANMNMYDWAKEDDDLVEVIYACMDGYIYFNDLRTGNATRDTMYLGFTFKGAGALDPRGYPIMYLGAGYDSNEGTARVFIINLLDCSVMYTFGNCDSFSLRGSLSYFDSSALVDAETDTLIYPGENGILYLMKLNTDYDEEDGSLSINPSNIVKWRYNGTRTGYESYWLGMEDSAAIYKGYLFITDNGGNLMCINLNTLEPVWVQDTLDDSNSTPVLSIEDGHLYLYVSTSFHLGWRSSTTAEVPIWKIDAQNGEIVWQTSYECYSEEGVSGGVQSTIAVGKYDLSDYIYVTVSKTGGTYSGVLACLNKDTGKIAWEHHANYTWSSPVCIYNSDGTGKVFYAVCGGGAYLLDGVSGEVNCEISLGDVTIEASPAVYEDMIVLGTRNCQILGIQLS